MRVELALAGYNLPNTTIVFLENIMMIVLQSGHYTIKESASNPNEITWPSVQGYFHGCVERGHATMNTRVSLMPVFFVKLHFIYD